MSSCGLQRLLQEKTYIRSLTCRLHGNSPYMDDKEICQPSSQLPGKPVSLWIDTTPDTAFPCLEGDTDADVAIIGGGIAGLTSALLLKRAGLKVALAESRRIVNGVTGYTTAKVTLAHGICYSRILNKFGQEQADVYADANQTAIDRVASFIMQMNIACDFTPLPAYIYAVTEDKKAEIEAEVRAGEKLGLAVSYVDTPPLPLPVKGAARFDGQAYFHPRKYLLAFADEINNGNGRIFENTRAINIEEGNPCIVRTDRGAIRAQYVVIATNYPIFDPLKLFMRLTPVRSYVLGLRLKNQPPQGLFYSNEDQFHSLRPHHLANNGAYLLAGGEEHPAGQGGNTIQRYKNLESYYRRFFDIESIDYHWSAQDNKSADMIPFIGSLAPASDKIFIATGFKGWGMAHGTIAGMLLSDLILGRSNPWKNLYSPARLNLPASVKSIASRNVQAVKHLISGYLSEESIKNLAEISKGEGKVIELDGEKAAVYRDEQGKIYALSPVCTHMGCMVSWNPAEKTWDCPCHGSRYACDGKVIHAPTVKDLTRIEL
jgi:glycine/D-amino acid oxidase-like deaminating enzyme/nitrite reductase/ring-hydroxylating ferredoxin subunit